MLTCLGLITPMIGRACHIKISGKIDTFRKATIGCSTGPPFFNSNDLSLARITPLTTKQITHDETGAPHKRKAETRSTTFCISSAESNVGQPGFFFTISLTSSSALSCFFSSSKYTSLKLLFVSL